MSSFTTADSKIHILYLVKNAPGVSYQMLLDKCMESLYIDFFTFCEVYNELIAGNLMDKTEADTGTGEVVGINETLSITKSGEAIPSISRSWPISRRPLPSSRKLLKILIP